MISITEKAAAKVKEISDSEGIGHYSVRVKVMGGGCAGFTYDMFYEDKASDMDEVVEFKDIDPDIKLIIDPISFQYLEDTTIDWLESSFGGGFKFLNPNVTGSCGCGNSVSF